MSRASSYHKIFKRLGEPVVVCVGEQEGQGQDIFGVLKPRGPEPQIAKEFRNFLNQLASVMNISVRELKNQGYRLSYFGERCEPKFPNQDMKKLFDEMRRSRRPVSAIIKGQRAKSSDHDESLVFNPRPMCLR